MSDLLSDLFASEGFRAALLGLVFAALYVLSRWVSRLNESRPRVEPPRQLEFPAAPGMTSPGPNVVSIDRRPQFHSSRVIDEDELLPVRIVQMYFAKFDYEPGPPDPKCFADELFVRLYNADHDYEWTGSYFVATPQGLDEMLQTEKWDYAYADGAIFVRKYDAKVIRQAVVEQLVSTVQKPNSPEPEDRYV
jgi:hypothetical protein